MKKVIVLILMLVCALALVACDNEVTNQKPNEEINEPQEEIKEPAENIEEQENTYFPKEDLNKYEVVQVIQLNENPTTGYGWQYKITDETIAVVEGDEYGEDSHEEGMTGVGGVHGYRLSGLKEGETEIIFKYMRSWEGEDSAVEIVTYGLSVNAENKLAITSETITKK